MFEGLLPEPHNFQILQLLFHFGHWHGLAKLRLHSNTMLEVLDELTTILGKGLRTFQSTTCTAFHTKELRKEASARHRRQATKTGANKGSAALDAPTIPTSTRRSKQFNLNTYKTHSLGDYVEAIRRYGTTDSYSTESVGSNCFYILLELTV